MNNELQIYQESQQYEELSNIVSDFEFKLGLLKRIGVKGVTIGIDLHLYMYKNFYSTYPKKWLEQYQSKSFILSDPIMRWTFAHSSGRGRWSDICKSRLFFSDPVGVMKKAQKYDLYYGCIMTHKMNKSSSMLSLARHDREITDDEMDEAELIFHNICDQALQLVELSTDEVATLKLVAMGLSRIEIANKLYVSEAAIKQRIARCVLKLGAKNTNHAIALAKTKRFF